MTFRIMIEWEQCLTVYPQHRAIGVFLTEFLACSAGHWLRRLRCRRSIEFHDSDHQ